LLDVCLKISDIFSFFDPQTSGTLLRISSVLKV